MIVGFTGTQQGMTENQKAFLRNRLPGNTFHHGDCVGADAQAHEIAQDAGCTIVIHPPMNPTKRAFCKGVVEMREPRQYLDRNHDIVLESEILIAAPKSLTEEIRSGTWATIRFARKLGRTVIILEP